GQAFCVRNNLGDFLRAFSVCDDFGLLYIDAICINQGDLAEKSSQVRLQSTIYSQATRVLCWLGVPTDTSEIVEEGLHRLARSKDWSSDDTGDDASVSAALEYIAGRPYWRRTWIVQEFLLAR
ncbi:hypothetical protein BAUCODRAFT_50168, partial [Baudoinia panamericana UAMH 10762]